MVEPSLNTAAPNSRFRIAVLNSHPIQYFAPLYRRLAARPDIDLTVFYCSRQNVAHGTTDPGFNREVLWDVPLLEGYDHRFLRNVGGERGVEGFISLVNPGIIGMLWRERYDALVVHGHAYLTILLAIVTARLRSTPVFMRGENNLTLRSRSVRRFFRYPALWLLYRLCDAFLYIGTLNREFYLHHRVAADKLFFVPYTVDNERFRAQAAARADDVATLRESLGIRPDSMVVLYASKLLGRKRPSDLLEVHLRLQRAGRRTDLLVVGAGAELEQLRARVADHRIPHVHFAGFRNQTELPLYYRAADVLVLPSDNEPWGLVVNEAMAVGLPVIATDRVGAAVDLIRNGVTGYSYPVGDLDTLEAHLTRLAAAPELRARMSANCTLAMQTWSYDECVAGILEALLAASAKRRARAGAPQGSPG